MKRKEAGSKDSAGETPRPRERKLERQATPERRGTQSSKSTGSCRTPADEKPSNLGTKDGGPTKHYRDQKNRGGSRREGTKIKLQAQTNEEEKANPAKVDPNKGGTKNTRRPKHRYLQSLDSRDAAGPSTSRPNSEAGGKSDQRKKQDPKGRGKEASQESDKGKGLPSSTGKGQTLVKYQDHRPGKSDPKNRNANSATQQETQPSVVRAQKSGQKRSFPIKDSAGETPRPKERKLERQATPERRGTQSSKSTGCCRTPADENPSNLGTKDGGPTKHYRDQKNWGGSRREGTKIKVPSQRNEEGKANPDLAAQVDPNKGGTKNTRRPKHRYSQSLDSQDAAGPCTSRPYSEAGGKSDQRKKQDLKGRNKGASRESDKGKGLPSSTVKGQTLVKYQDHRLGKSDPKNRNANSATQQETQPSVVRAQKSGQKRSLPIKDSAGETPRPKERKLKRQATPERRGTQSSKSTGCCRTPADENPSNLGTKDGGPTKHNRDQKNRGGSRREDLAAKIDPNKGGAKNTRRPKHRSSQSLDSRDGAGPCASRPNSEAGGKSDQRKKQDPKGRGKEASRESDKGKGLPSSTGKGQTLVKYHRLGKPDSKNRNANSATRQETQPSVGRAQKSGQKRSFLNKGNTLDLKTLKEKDCTEVVHKLNESMAGLKFILTSEEEQHITDDFIFDLTCTLATACDAPAGENSNKILATLKGSAFFSSKIPYLLDRIQTSKTAISDSHSQRRLIESLIKVFNKYLMHLPSSYADPPYDPLRETLDQSNIDGKEELKERLHDFKLRRDDIIKAERQKLGRRYANKTSQKPPNDFRDIPICPTNEEIKSQERPFLRKNIKKGRYQDVEHYLDVQFRLLREDFLEPLREGIYEITHNIPRRERNQMMKCYQGVRIVGKEFTLSGVNHMVQFDVSKFGMPNWAQSKKLIFGSFLCLSKDNFETMLFATVANRDPKDLSEGRFHIRFIEEQNIFDIEKRQQQYQMVESPAYYEAYGHVLKGLKRLNEDTMPFTKYLVECSAEVDPPEYLRREDDQDPVYYDLSKALAVPNLPEAKKVPVLESEAWPSVQALHLNRSQLEALRTAVTTEFAVIQGPPGTGKTYVGAKIVRCLLENRNQWDPDETSPMLMVCYTNHALDQFLEKVLEFLPKREIIRVGGRCKSKQLEECNLKLFTKSQRNYNQRALIQRKIMENKAELDVYKAGLAKADDDVLEFKHLESFMTAEQADQLYDAVFPPKVRAKCRKTSNTFKLWLSDNKHLNHLNQRQNSSKESETDENQDGSILSQDLESEVIDYFYVAPGPEFESRTTNADSDDDLIGSEEQTEDSLKESTTKIIPRADAEAMSIFESDQGQSTNSKEDNSLIQNDLSVDWTQKIPAEVSSKSQTLLDDRLETNTVPVPAVTQDLKEQSRLSDLLINKEADDLTITVEDEATRIHNERYIEGDEEYTLAISHKSLEDVIYDDSERERIEEIQEKTEVSYGRESNTFVWELASRSSEPIYSEKSPRKTTTDARSKKETEAKKEDLHPFVWQVASGGRKLIDSENSQKEATTEARTKQERETNDSNTFVWLEASRAGETRPTAHGKINLTGDISNLKTQLQKLTVMSDNEATRLTNIWELSAEDRLRLYLNWVECYRERKRIEIQRVEQKHEELRAKLEETNAEDEEVVIRRATVVGMTTSGAARYHSMLQRISPKIVIVEEAAEVLEAHIITSFSRNTKHTILIGDHKQLRPKATVYKLAQEYNLEISLFERMVSNSMDCKRLSTQHRMRPEIAALTKRIYEHEIVDHESVCAFEDISGLKHNMFFIDHHQPEELVGGMQSFSNPHEAGFLVALCRYLLLQGYKREQITILTMYTGQILELKNRMPRSEFGGIKVCVVDNFQGEENDIILLSLVRSSKIGFLKESNRICVALSRARQGFYCIGNFTLLKTQCMLWKEICDDLQPKKAIGQILTLVCERHNNANEVQNSRDIQKFRLGGCDKLCGVRLDCGHACDSICHPTDEFHEPGRCSKVCWKSCPNDHHCRRLCHHPSKCFCTRPMVKIIPRCGHEQTVECYIEPENFLCQVKCEKTLNCGHQCKNICGSRCTTRCNVECNKTLPCGHEKIMLCFKDPIFYNQCKSDCKKVLECGHPCSRKCKELCQCNTTIDVDLPCKHQKRVLCPIRNQPLLCFEECRRGLQCGHQCPGLCHEDCNTFQCEILVEKILPCDHKQILPCHFDPLDISCQEMCQKKCNRGHPCQQRCHYGYSCKDCIVRVNMTIPSCNHSIEMPCYLDPAAIQCRKPCERVRTCGHPCRDVCRKNCDARPCMKLVPRTLRCGHTVTLACNKNLQTYKCKAKVVVELKCGHKKPMDCYVKEAGLQNVLCNEKVDKELPCKHKAILPCHKNIEEHKCMKKVDVTMTCGHTNSVTCSAEKAGRLPLCMVMRARKLSCEHEVTIPCCEYAKDYKCSEKVDITMSCGHIRHLECSKTRKVSDDEKCNVVVEKKLPCGHAKEMQCSVKPGDIFCDAPCERALSCNHSCRGRCSDDCSKVQCAERVEKNLSCGHHKISCLCHDDVSQIICPNKCTRKLLCGHICIGKCSEKCSDYQCEEMVMKKLNCPGVHYLRISCAEDPTAIVCLQNCRQKLDCGHPCKGLCGQQCGTMKCMRKIEMTFPCGHKKWLPCFLRKTATCRAPCLRPKSSCGHLCKGWCGDSCSKYPCNKPVTRTLRCGHKIEMRCCHNPEYVRCPAVCGAKLQCGHQCSGTCGDCQQRNSHKICQNPCPRILVCLHRCRGICCEPCPPCASWCSRRCPHDKCKEHCSKPCNPCGQPCTWSCPHYQCNNLCGEECDRPRCDAPCLKKLPACGHQCIGLCGENCPTACAICHAEKLSMLSNGRVNKTEPTRCLQLFDCGHIITVKTMDEWMLRQQSSDVQLMRCPRCSTSITFSYRYGNLVKRTLKNVDHVKAQVHELTVEVSNSVHVLGEDLRHLNFDAEKLKFPQTVLRVMQFFPRDVRLDESSILFLFMAKNHLTILKKAQATQQVLGNLRTAQGIYTQQGDMEQLDNITTKAIENIKEYLEQPQLNLKTLCQVLEHTRKFFLFSHVLEAQMEAAKQQAPFSRMANNRLKVAYDRFLAFLQGKDHALDREWLRATVHLLRTELHLAPLPPEEAEDFANFPGYQKGVWRTCDQGHVYFTAWIVRDGKDIPVGYEGCSRCTAAGMLMWSY